jgi:hypothetical protein
VGYVRLIGSARFHSGIAVGDGRLRVDAQTAALSHSYFVRSPLTGVWLRSEAMNLAGKLDLLLVTDHGCYPVDFKDTEGSV